MFSTVHVHLNEIWHTVYPNSLEYEMHPQLSTSSFNSNKLISDNAK